MLRITSRKGGFTLKCTSNATENGSFTVPSEAIQTRLAACPPADEEAETDLIHPIVLVWVTLGSVVGTVSVGVAVRCVLMRRKSSDPRPAASQQATTGETARETPNSGGGGAGQVDTYSTPKAARAASASPDKPVDTTAVTTDGRPAATAVDTPFVRAKRQGVAGCRADRSLKDGWLDDRPYVNV